MYSQLSRQIPSGLAIATVLAGGAFAEVTSVITVAVKEGDAVAGVGNLTSIDTISVGQNGAWLVEGDTNNVNTNADQVVLLNGVLSAREGDAVAQPAGATISSFGPGGTRLISTNSRAWNYFLDGLTTTTDSGIYFDAVLVIQEGAIATAPQFTPGTPYIGFFGAELNESTQIAIMASIDDVAITSTVDRALVIADIDGSGNLLSESVFAMEGDVLPGQVDTLADFGTGPHSWNFNDDGDLMFVADLNGLTTTDGVVYLNNTLLAQEGDPSPIAGRNWLTLSSSLRVALNDDDDYAFTGTLDGNTATDSVIVLNGGVFVQEGNVPPGIAGFTLTSFGTGAVELDGGGNLYWFGDWNDPDTSKDTGIFRNCQLLVQEGVTIIGGQVLESIATVQENLQVDEEGRWLIFEGTLAGGVSGAFLIEMTESHTTYCTAGTTTNGCTALIEGNNDASAAGLIDFEIAISGVEGQKSGLIFYGVSGPLASPWGMGSSFLCVKAPTQRTPPQSSGGLANTCTGTLVLDWDAYVAANPTTLGGPFAAGDTAWFQGWFRDPPSPKTTNLSNALEIEFCP